MENEFKKSHNDVFKKIDPTIDKNKSTSENNKFINKKEVKKKSKKRKKRKKKEPKICQLDTCNCKLGFVKIQCRCGYYFCSKHRQNHSCTYDYKKNSKVNKALIAGDSNFKKLEKI
jgi:hypothetical protein